MAKTIINARVIDQALLLENLPALASGGVNEIQVNFSFCDLWTGATKKTAVFFRNPVEVHHAELADDACTAPWEVFAAPGTVYMGVFAEYADGTTRTCEALPLSVNQGAITKQSAAANAPNIYAALEQRVAAMENSAVLYTEQNLTEKQKEQARKNVGAAAATPTKKAFYGDGDTATIHNVQSLVLYGKTVNTSSRNLCSVASVEVVGDAYRGSVDVDIEEIPAGIYSISAYVESNADVTRQQVQFLDASGTSVKAVTLRGSAASGVRKSYENITIPSAFCKLRLFSGENNNSSINKTTTFTDIQIEAGSVSTEYEPYGGGSDGISAEVSFNDVKFFADVKLFDGDSLNFANGALNRNDGTASVIPYTGDISSLNGTYNISAKGDIEITTIQEAPYVSYGYDQALTNDQKTNARANIGAASQADMDSLGHELIVSKNLFDLAAITEPGQWVRYSTGVREFYPENQYIAKYCTSGDIAVEGGKTYTLSGGSTEGKTSLHSYAIYTVDGVFIEGAFPELKNADPYVVEMPSNAGYIVINLHTDGSTWWNTLQFELGAEATAYEPFGVLRNVLNGVQLQQEQILYDNARLLQLPTHYNLVVGDTFELFYKGVMLCKDPYAYNILVSCDVGNAYSRKYVLTPTEPGTHTLTIQVTNDFGKVLDTKSVQLVVSAKMASPASNINVLCLGDSLTAGGNWVDEVFRRLTKTTAVTQYNAAAPLGDGLSKITFVGKKTTANGAGYEGTGGWRYSHYIDASNADNPFVYSGKVDFAAYCSALGINRIDQCYILLGWNMAAIAETNWKADAKALIDLLIAHNSAIKIVLMGLQIPACDGLAENYDIDSVYANYRAMQEYVFNVDKWNKDIAAAYPNNVSSISIAGQFDTENNMPTTTTTPNIRNAAQIIQQSNGVHPAYVGYYQIADAVYRKFTADNA